MEMFEKFKTYNLKGVFKTSQESYTKYATESNQECAEEEETIKNANFLFRHWLNTTDTQS